MAHAPRPPERGRWSAGLRSVAAWPPAAEPGILQQTRVELEDAHLAEPVLHFRALGHALQVHEAHCSEGLWNLRKEPPRVLVPLAVGAEEDLVRVHVQEPVDSVALGLVQSPLDRHRLAGLDVFDLRVQPHSLLVHLALPLVEARPPPRLCPPFVSTKHHMHRAEQACRPRGRRVGEAPGRLDRLGLLSVLRPVKEKIHALKTV
mmetsp:Transcript_93524/g.273855  ORF Transcript_93524/g.273855 Transcript_93524/m.273855 type:complete len:204 (+) Transcript_93524:843-1454(+)